MKRFIFGFLTAIALFAVSGIGIMYSGIYNVAASVPDSALERWALATTMVRSIEAHAATVSAPPEFSDEQRQAGFHAYNEMCVACHGAPGRDQGEIGQGLAPQPPNLMEAAEHWASHELFWIVKNGIKMTGMPAFGKTHTDNQVWDMVAFLEQLPSVTPEQYVHMMEEQGAAGDHNHMDNAEEIGPDSNHHDGGAGTVVHEH